MPSHVAVALDDVKVHDVARKKKCQSLVQNLPVNVDDQICVETHEEKFEKLSETRAQSNILI